MEFLIILFLIILNGLLSMSEIAIISVKKSKLTQLAEEGDNNAKTALKLTDNPNRFFSTIQVGITLIGVVTGAFGGITLAEPVSGFFDVLGFPTELSNNLAFFVVVIAITYLSLIIGELVPKRLGLHFPDKLALWLARPMFFLSQMFSPIVNILSTSTDAVLNLLPISSKKQPSVSLEEVRFLITEGAQLGVFDMTGKDIAEKALNLGEIHVDDLLTPRNKIIWIEYTASSNDIKRTIVSHQYSYYPVCVDTLDNIKGIVNAESVLTEFIENGELNIKAQLHRPILIPENKKVIDALEIFKKTGIHMGLVINEYGAVQGLLTLTDILEAIVGDLPEINDQEETDIIQRDDNSWFVDGLVSINVFKDYFEIEDLEQLENEDYHTVGGFVMTKLGKIPKSGDHFETGGMRFEVADMDGNRVDKVMVRRIT